MECNSDGVPGALNEKDYQSVGMMFSFFCAFIDKATGYKRDMELTKLINLYSELVLQIYGRFQYGRWKFNELMVLLRKFVKELKE